MKTAKLVIGIVSMVLFLFIVLQSCAAGMSNALESNGEVSGTAGLIVGSCMLIAAIVGVVTRKGGKGGAFTAGGFYLAGGMIGLICAGSYTDLYIWSTLSLIIGVVFNAGTIISTKKSDK